MPAPALFGIENSGLNTVVNLLVLFLGVLWLALVFYTYKDAVRRIGDPVLVTTATATSLVFPFIGTIVYLILRPPEYLEDVRERELEIAAAEARLLQMHELACPYCAFPVERTFLRCPSCLKRLKEPCATCRKPLDPRWKICPYCEADVQAQGRRRRPAASERERPAQPAGEARSGTQGRAGAQRRSGARPEQGQPAPNRAQRPAPGQAGTSEGQARSQPQTQGPPARPAQVRQPQRPTGAPQAERQRPAPPERPDSRGRQPSGGDGEAPEAGQPTVARPGGSQ